MYDDQNELHLEMIDRCNLECESVSAERDALRAELATLRAELASLRASDKNWADLHERAIHQRNDYGSQLRAAKEEIVRIGVELECKQREIGLLRGELAAAKEQRGLLEGYIVDAHFRAFGDRHYAYVDCRSACDLLVADITATQHERDAATAQVSDLRAAGEALVQRWDTPGWKDVPHTGVFINALRAALARTTATSLAAHDASVLREVAAMCEFHEAVGYPIIGQQRLLLRAAEIEAEAKGNTV